MEVIREETVTCAEEMKKLQAVLYTFACKFLTEEEVRSLKEETGMTILGKMLGISR